MAEGRGAHWANSTGYLSGISLFSDGTEYVGLGYRDRQVRNREVLPKVPGCSCMRIFSGAHVQNARFLPTLGPMPSENLWK